MVVVFDLDDTLYDEETFVKSGLREVSNYLHNRQYYDFMIDIFEREGSGKIFNKLIKEFHLDVPLQKLIEIYRFHKPKISLPHESRALLQYARKHKTALISDGHYIMQQNKFNALGLSSLIDYPVFTDFFHTRKPELVPYEMVMKRYQDEAQFIYISDNPKKDFFAVETLGWTGIRYKNPVGLYRNITTNTHHEVTSREAAITLLEGLDNA